MFFELKMIKKYLIYKKLNSIYLWFFYLRSVTTIKFYIKLNFINLSIELISLDLWTDWDTLQNRSLFLFFIYFIFMICKFHCKGVNSKILFHLVNRSKYSCYFGKYNAMWRRNTNRNLKLFFFFDEIENF